MDNTLEQITIMTGKEDARLTQLMSKAESDNGVSVEESNERSSLIFKQQANTFKVLATDDNIDEKSDDNYEVQALKNWDAYLQYS